MKILAGEFINQRYRLYYGDGSLAMIGDRVNYAGKIGIVVNLDPQSVNIRYDDGSGVDNIQIQNVTKVANVVDDVLKDAKWIKI